MRILRGHRQDDAAHARRVVALAAEPESEMTMMWLWRAKNGNLMNGDFAPNAKAAMETADAHRLQRKRRKEG